MPETIQQRFGERVREVRRSKGISQEALAEKAGLSPAYFGRVERGGPNVTLKTIYKIARALDVPAKKLMP
jgi:transcriptional regulator with XRE-family HTH domain